MGNNIDENFLKLFNERKLVEHIEWFDGPLLSHFINHDIDFMFSWCDITDTTHIWLVFETDKNKIEDYKTSKCDMLTLITSWPPGAAITGA